MWEQNIFVEHHHGGQRTIRPILRYRRDVNVVLPPKVQRADVNLADVPAHRWVVHGVNCSPPRSTKQMAPGGHHMRSSRRVWRRRWWWWWRRRALHNLRVGCKRASLGRNFEFATSCAEAATPSLQIPILQQHATLRRQNTISVILRKSTTRS